MTMLDLAPGPVWYDEQGDGEPVVLLHGGAVDGRFFDANVPALAGRFRVIRIDLWGHGRSPDREGPFSLESFAADVAEVVERVVGGPVHLVGHSIGAGVALAATLRRPDLVRKLVVISGGLRPDRETVITDEMIAQTAAFLGSSYGEVSPDGEAHFPVVIRKDFELSSREPDLTADDVRRVTARTLVMTADDDLGQLEEQLELYRALPAGELAVVPGTSHFLLQEKPELVNAILLDFLANDPVPVVAPIRRAPGGAPA